MEQSSEAPLEGFGALGYIEVASVLAGRAMGPVSDEHLVLNRVTEIDAGPPPTKAAAYEILARPDEPADHQQASVPAQRGAALHDECYALGRARIEARSYKAVHEAACAMHPGMTVYGPGDGLHPHEREAAVRESRRAGRPGALFGLTGSLNSYLANGRSSALGAAVLLWTPAMPLVAAVTTRRSRVAAAFGYDAFRWDARFGAWHLFREAQTVPLAGSVVVPTALAERPGVVAALKPRELEFTGSANAGITDLLLAGNTPAAVTGTSNAISSTAMFIAAAAGCTIKPTDRDTPGSLCTWMIMDMIRKDLDGTSPVPALVVGHDDFTVQDLVRDLRGANGELL
ncbi:hypothetical protein [Kitasatospora sp. NPDC050543]|uniref:hypothetical protein n=1 Tax=Kitasatospora sp. NPDC050543 TaxID=3364054 RepID=UPI0037A99131